MTASPFTPAARPIPVTLVTDGQLPVRAEGVALLHLQPALHEHAAGTECVACAASGDIRAMLFDLLTERRTSGEPLAGVVIDARDLQDAEPIRARLGAAEPAKGLRDHTVLRSFVLAG